MKAVAPLAIACLFATALPCAAATIDVKMICGPHSSDPAKLKAYQVNFPVEFSRGVFTAAREVSDNGKETFNGIVSYSGDVLLIGNGSRPSGGAWNYEFKGKAKADGTGSIKGSLKNTSGAVGGRQCMMNW